MTKTACIFGSTGLTGSHLLSILCADSSYNKIIVFNRLAKDNLPQQVEQIVGDFNSLMQYAEKLKANHYFCCLGSTMKKAGSKEAFEYVDYHLPVKIAEMAYENKADKVLVVSSVGASAKSRNFYLNVKGRMEDKMRAIMNDKLYIFKPSMLLGERNENRLGESFGKILMKALGILFIGSFKKYKAIEAQKVALAMVKVANGNYNQVVFESDEIQNIAIL